MQRGKRTRHTVDSANVVCILLAVACLIRAELPEAWAVPTLQAWSTVFAAICIQAAPYVVVGVALSVVLTALPAGWLGRALPRRPGRAVLVAALAGVTLPGCECGSVPVAAALIRRGIMPGPAVALMLSAPATNPVVLAATATAFPGQPALVIARFAASLLVALGVGWCQPRRQLRQLAHDDHCAGSASQRMSEHAAHELARSLGLLTFGAASAATLTVLVPRSAFDRLSASETVGIFTLGALAVVLAVCSEADAFIASSLIQFSRLAQLAFMVVGPAVDVKLIAMQAGAFGGRFAARVSLLSFALALAAAIGVGGVLL